MPKNNSKRTKSGFTIFCFKQLTCCLLTLNRFDNKISVPPRFFSKVTGLCHFAIFLQVRCGITSVFRVSDHCCYLINHPYHSRNYSLYHLFLIFIFVPCIFIKLIFFYQQLHFYLTHKIIKFYIKTLFYSHSYMFRSVQIIIREPILSLAKIRFL